MGRTTWPRAATPSSSPTTVTASRLSTEAARQAWEKLGELSGPELEAPGGRRYRAGDRVITLAPGPDGAWVTSQRAVVTSVDPEAQSLVARHS